MESGYFSVRILWDPHCPIHGPQPGKLIDLQLQYSNNTNVPEEMGGIRLAGLAGPDDAQYGVSDAHGATLFLPTITHLEMSGEREVQLRYIAVVDGQQVGQSQLFRVSQPLRATTRCARIVANTLAVSLEILLPGGAEPDSTRCAQVSWPSLFSSA